MSRPSAGPSQGGPRCAAPGFHLSLFHALDSADLVAIDGCDLLPRYDEIAPRRRRIRLANEDDLTVDDQDVRIVSGAATFVDVEGYSHQVLFSVERPLDESTAALGVPR